LSSSLSREHLALTAEFLRGDEYVPLFCAMMQSVFTYILFRAYFVDLLASFVKSARFTRHEYSEYVAPVNHSETLAAEADPSTTALELAHTIAFRSGLGASLFASEHSSVTAEDIKAFASSAFAHSNIAVLGTGISQEKLASLVSKALGQASSSASSASASISSPASTYFGGETRHTSHSGPQTVFIGYGVSGAPSPALSTLAAHLSPSPSIKWSQGTSPLSGLSASVETVVLPYSDATLFGFLIKGETAESVKEAGKAAVKALKEAKEIKDDVLKTAIAKAKFEAASKLESREGLLAALGSKVRKKEVLRYETIFS
jgi:ubiquinol-cytochrome c reductase core subunit 2